jgi:hypothetical protein
MRNALSTSATAARIEMVTVRTSFLMSRRRYLTGRGCDRPLPAARPLMWKSPRTQGHLSDRSRRLQRRSLVSCGRCLSSTRPAAFSACSRCRTRPCMCGSSAYNVCACKSVSQTSGGSGLQQSSVHRSLVIDPIYSQKLLAFPAMTHSDPEESCLSTRFKAAWTAAICGTISMHYRSSSTIWERVSCEQCMTFACTFIYAGTI